MYQRITLPLRYQLQALRQAGHSCTTIAHQLGFHRTAISRELKRVTPYNAEEAHQHALVEQSRRHSPRILEATWNAVTEKLRLFHSPEQIHGRCQQEGQPCPSIEAIYLYVYQRPELASYLRQGRKSRRHRHSDRNPPALWTSITHELHCA